MFEVVSQAYQNNPFIENSSSFMRDLGAINLRDNLSIVITPLKTKDFIMTHLRDQLKYNNEYKNEQVKLSHFIEDFRTYADASLKKLIEDSNKNKSFDNISKELMDELMNNLIDNDRDLSGKFKNHQKTKRTIKEKDDSIQVEENQIDNSFLDLLDEYPLIRYNLTLSSLEKNIPEEEQSKYTQKNILAHLFSFIAKECLIIR
jgi:N-acyl-D-aspartate/D-glutamate deacylase